MDNTGLALQNQAAVNEMFAKGLAPLGNYAAQNLQLGIAQQRAEQERAQRIYEMQMQNQFQKQREADQYDYNRRLAAQAEAASFKTNQFVQESTAKREADQTRLLYTLQEQKKDAEDAKLLRENPDVKRILGAATLNQFKDTPEGNVGLKNAWNAASANPDVQEDLNTSKVVNWAKQARQVLNNMTNVSPGSEEGRRAVTTFLQQPGVIDLLTKKGDFTTDEINQILTGGDPSKVIAAIKKVGNEAFWSLSGQTREAQLMTSWSTALAQSQGQPSGSGITKMNFLQNMLKNIDSVMPNLTKEDSLNRVSQALGVTMVTPKTPPPPIGGGLSTPSQVPGAQISADNPFAPPPPQNQNLTPLARAIMPSPMSSAMNSVQGLHDAMGVSKKDAAFYPQRIASDPHTEFAVRSKLLDNSRTQEAALSGISQGFYTPRYDAFSQMKDEANIKRIVDVLYSPQAQAPQAPTLPQNLFQNPFASP